MELNHIKQKNKMNSKNEHGEIALRCQSSSALPVQREDTDQCADVISNSGLGLTSLSLQRSLRTKYHHGNNSRKGIIKISLMLTFMLIFKSTKIKNITLKV